MSYNATLQLIESPLGLFLKVFCEETVTRTKFYPKEFVTTI